MGPGRAISPGTCTVWALEKCILKKFELSQIQKSLVLGLTVIAVALATSSLAHAREYTSHEGYTAEVQNERTEVISEMAMIEAPTPLGPPLKDQIFDEKLTKDFKERYEQKFGRTEAERVYNSPNRFTYYTDLYTFRGSPEEEDIEKRAYANYMVKKLAEYHVEKYMKSDPKTKSVWEAKERISQANVGSGSFKVKARYDLVGGKADVEIQNPLVETKATLEMTGSRVKESIIVLKRPITKSIALESRYKNVEGILSFVATKTFSPVLYANLTASTYTNHNPVSTRESLYLAGLNYVF